MIFAQRQLIATLVRGCLASFALLVSAMALAQEQPPKSGDSTKSEQHSESKVVTKALGKPAAPIVVDEKAALLFASTHHPELAEILQTLRKSNKQQFQAAITDLSREQERINRAIERDGERAKIVIAAWQVDSRIRLEVARYTMTQDSEREARIKELLKERSSLKRQLLEFDRRRTQQRLAKMDEQLAQQSEHAEKQLTAEWERLKKSVAGQAKKPTRTTDAKKAE